MKKREAKRRRKEDYERGKTARKQGEGERRKQRSREVGKQRHRDVKTQRRGEAI